MSCAFANSVLERSAGRAVSKLSWGKRRLCHRTHVQRSRDAKRETHAASDRKQNPIAGRQGGGGTTPQKLPAGRAPTHCVSHSARGPLHPKRSWIRPYGPSPAKPSRGPHVPRSVDPAAIGALRKAGTANWWSRCPVATEVTSASRELLECCPMPRPTMHRNWAGASAAVFKTNYGHVRFIAGVAWSRGIFVITSSRAARIVWMSSGL